MAPGNAASKKSLRSRGSPRVKAGSNGEQERGFAVRLKVQRRESVYSASDSRQSNVPHGGGRGHSAGH
ncbi:hypothetical protein PBY51_008935 [Eleginops maclovinus]|uniref:Uncharacterized protein n=1 Tax=Eleginops maclovinus TaxID=56733 RepID=A0AAN8A2T6_ELEMC|nr:hypothetical protein PBY51_008935 [Eleginops maclovinus]